MVKKTRRMYHTIMSKRKLFVIIRLIYNKFEFWVEYGISENFNSNIMRSGLILFWFAKYKPQNKQNRTILLKRWFKNIWNKYDFLRFWFYLIWFTIFCWIDSVLNISMYHSSGQYQCYSGYCIFHFRNIIVIHFLLFFPIFSITSLYSVFYPLIIVSWIWASVGKSKVHFFISIFVLIWNHKTDV